VNGGGRSEDPVGRSPTATATGAPFDPNEPAEYDRLLRQARRDAAIHGADPSLGEDALHDVLARVASGKRKPLRNARYFRVCVIYRLRDLLRRERKESPIEESFFAEDDPHALDRRLLLLGLVSVQPEGGPEEGEEDLRPRLARALEALGEDQRRAVLAKLRGWLEQRGGREGVEAFERHWGVDVGLHTGTAALASALGRRPGTVASWAHRGIRKLAGLLRSST